MEMIKLKKIKIGLFTIILLILSGCGASLHSQVRDKKNNVSVISTLKNDKSQIDLKEKATGNTLLMESILNDNDEITLFLLDNGANINLKNDKDETPLISSAKKGNMAIASTLIEKGANLEDENVETKETALFYALKSNNDDLVRKMVEKGADVNKTNIYMETPLIIAVKTNNIANVTLLLESKVKIDWQDNQKNSALIYAAKNGNYEILKLLIEKGANVHLNNRDEKDAMYYLCIEKIKNNLNSIKILINAGYTVPKNILETVVLGGNKEIFDFFLGKGYKIDIKDSKNIGNVILGGNMELLEYFEKKGGDLVQAAETEELLANSIKSQNYIMVKYIFEKVPKEKLKINNKVESFNYYGVASDSSPASNLTALTSSFFPKKEFVTPLMLLVQDKKNLELNNKWKSKYSTEEYPKLIDLVKMAIKIGADVNSYEGETGESVLMRSITRGEKMIYCMELRSYTTYVTQMTYNAATKSTSSVQVPQTSYYNAPIIREYGTAPYNYEVIEELIKSGADKKYKAKIREFNAVDYAKYAKDNKELLISINK